MTLQKINLEENKIKNLTTEGKRIQKIAQNLTRELEKKHNCNFFNGGCVLFAELMNMFYEEQKEILKTEYKIIGRKDNIDHIILKVYRKDKSYYVDADGIATEDEIKYKMIFLEQIPENNIGIKDLKDLRELPNSFGIQEKKEHIKQTKQDFLKKIKIHLSENKPKSVIIKK